MLKNFFKTLVVGSFALAFLSIFSSHASAMDYEERAWAVSDSMSKVRCPVPGCNFKCWGDDARTSEQHLRSNHKARMHEIDKIAALHGVSSMVGICASIVRNNGNVSEWIVDLAALATDTIGNCQDMWGVITSPDQKYLRDDKNV